MMKNRGGQPGNRNALKHGFYSDGFKKMERDLLDRTGTLDFSGEIELLRVQIHRYLEAEIGTLDRMDYRSRLEALHAVSLAMSSLTRLARIQLILNAYSCDRTAPGQAPKDIDKIPS